MLFGPLWGILAGLVVGLVAMPQDPNFVSNGGHAAPGDGITVTVFYSRWVGCFNTSFGSVGLATLVSLKCNRRIKFKLNHYPMTLSTTISEVPVVK
jgi:hypothetical protein